MKDEKFYLTHITRAVRDCLDSVDGKPELPATHAYNLILEMFDFLKLENPDTKRINELKDRIKDLATQNREFRRQLGLPRESLPLSYELDKQENEE